MVSGSHRLGWAGFAAAKGFQAEEPAKKSVVSQFVEPGWWDRRTTGEQVFLIVLGGLLAIRVVRGVL